MISEEEEGEAKMRAAADMYDDEHMRSFLLFLFFFFYGKDFGQTPMSCFFLCNNGKGKGILDKTDEEFLFFFFFFILQWTRGFWKQ
jgi:hypothetical protein